MKTNFRVVLATTLVAILTAGQASAGEFWHIKCFTARGQTLPVKALSDGETAYDIKAIGADGSELMDVKAIPPGGGLELPIKVVASSDEGAAYSDVKVIDKANRLQPVKAFTEHGKILSVKAYYNESSGQFDIKCLGESALKLALKAISPQGRVFDVKGIKDLPGQDQLQVDVQAHVMAKPQDSASGS